MKKGKKVLGFVALGVAVVGAAVALYKYLLPRQEDIYEDTDILLDEEEEE